MSGGTKPTVEIIDRDGDVVLVDFNSSEAPMLRLKAQAGFRAVPAALLLRDKGGLKLADAKKVVDDLSEGASVAVSLNLPGLDESGSRRRTREVVEGLRACRVSVEETREAARA